MKTAVLIFGELREFDIAITSWKFLENIDYDMYVNTWNWSKEENLELGIDIEESVDEHRILKYFPNANVNIEEDTRIGLISTRMLYHIRMLFNRMVISGVKYDNVILLRPDIYFDDTIEIESLLIELPNKNILYGLSTVNHPPPPIFNFVNDCVFIGTLELMRNTFLSFPEPDITRKNIHYHLAKHFINNDIYIQPIWDNYSPQHLVLRSLHRNYMHCSFIELIEIEHIYQTIKHLMPIRDGIERSPKEIIRITELKLRLKELEHE